MDRKAVIAELQRVAKERHTDCLSRSTFQQLATISSGAVEKVFGSWNEAIAAAGLTPLPQGGLPTNEKRRLERVNDPPTAGIGTGRIPDDELLDDLVRLAKELGRRPSGNQIASKGKYDPTVYRRRWGVGRKGLRSRGPTATVVAVLTASTRLRGNMPQSLPRLLYHLIFSTKNRDPLIDDAIEAKLHAYMAGICAELGGKPIRINGMPDHVHVLTYLPPTVTVSNALRDLKASSSRWVHQSFAGRQAFAWQAGYAAFSVSPSKLADVRDYIANQKDHHKSVSFQDEYRAFLRRHGIEWDERYVWD